MASVSYQGMIYELTEAEYDALCDYGPDVAARVMTGDEAIYNILIQSIHGKRARLEGHMIPAPQ